MYRTLYSEVYKLKASRILLIIPIVALMVAFSIFNVYRNRVEYPVVNWYMLLEASQVLMYKYASLLTALFTGYIFTREYKEGTASVLLTYPHSRLTVLLSKYLLLLPLLACTFIVILLFSMGTGFVLARDTLTAEIVWLNFKIAGLAVVTHLALVPAASLVSMLGKNMVAPSIYGLCSMLSLCLFLLTPYKFFWPWCLPSVLAAKMYGFRYGEFTYLFSGYEKSSGAMIVLFTAAFLVPLGLNLLLYLKSDVK